MGNKLKVLLVEDDPGDTHLIREILTDVEVTGSVGFAFDLECADRLSTGLERLAAGGIDVVLLDLWLPDSRGLDTFGKVQAQAPQVPILVLIGLDNEELAVKAVRNGAQDYLIKGQIDNNLLMRSIRHAIERKQAEEALRASQEYARSIIDSSLDMIIAVDVDRHIVEFNKAAERTFGYRREEVLGVHVDILYADPQEGLRVHQETVEKGQCVREILDKRKNGEVFPCFLSSSVLRNARGELVGVMGVSRDITERKWAEEALRESELQYRTTLDSMGDAIHVVDADLRFVVFNTAFKQWNKELGLETDVIGRTIFEVFPFLPDRVRDEYHQVFDAGKMLITEESTKVGGREFFTETRKTPILEEGRVSRIITVIRDITERKRAEEEIRKLSQFHERVIDNASVWLNVLDEKANVVIWNKAAEEISGYSREEVVGHDKIWEWLYPDEEYRNRIVSQAIAIIEEGEEEREAETTIRRKDGQTRVISWSSRNLVDEKGAPIGSIALGSDITERKWAEEALKRRMEQLAVVNQVARQTASILELDKLLQKVVTALQQSFDYYHVGLFLLDEAAGELKMRAIAGGFADIAPPDHHLALGEGMAGWAAETGQLLLANDVSQEPRYVLGILRESLTKAELCVPLKLADKMIGVLDIQSTQLNAFDEIDLMAMETLADQLAVAIENARLYEAEAQGRQEAETLRKAAMALTSTLDLEETLDRILEQLHGVVAYDSASVHLLRDEHSEIVGGRGFADLSAVIGLRFPVPGDNPNTRVIESGEPVILANAQVAHAPFREPPHDHIRSWLGVPMRFREQTIGLITLDSTELGHFTADHARLAAAFANQAAVAIENARLYQETARRLEETQAFGAVTIALTRSLDLDQVLQAIVESAARLVPASTSSVIHLVDEAGGKLIPWAASVPKVGIESMGMSIGEGIAGLVVQEKRLINVPDVDEDPSFVVTDTRIRSLLTAPLMIDGGCIGTISLNSDQVGAFSADDERLLATLAAQAAVAVRNARLHQEVQHRVEELTFLNRVGRTVTSSLNLEQVLTTVMEETVLMLGTGAVSILLLDEESGELAFEAAVGTQPGEMKGLRLPLGQGIAGWVAREGEPLLVPDVREDPRFYPGIDEITGFVTRSILAVPLKVRGKVIGVIEAVNKNEGDFSQADVELLSSMAQWATIAIENTQLFAETQRRFEEMAALYDVSLDITSRLEMLELLKSIVERAVALLRAGSGGIHLYDPEWDELRLAITYDSTEEYVGVTLKPGEGMAGRVFQSGKPMIVDDYHTWEGRAAAFEADQTPIAVLAVPLKWHEQVIGVLTINANPQERTFNQDDIWLVTLFANQAAIAIENARLYEELQNRMEELKRAQAQLIQSAKLAAIGKLAAGVAHEINNPLTSIMGFTRLLLQEVDEDDPRKKDLVIIDQEAARTKDIVRGLLDFARQREPQLEPVDVNEIVRSTMALVRHQAKSAGVTIQESCDETLPLVALDADQMKQVFLNMMTNAIQAMSEGGELKVVTAYWPQVQNPELAKESGSVDCVAVEFHDTGIGISVEHLPRIFDPFFTTKEVGHGTGLGLSISYGIVERHGGWIEVKSEVGRGSTFTVVLPTSPQAGGSEGGQRTTS